MPDQLQLLYKLMTLYTLSQVDFALTNSQLSNVFLDLGYTNYFNVQYTLGDLVDAGLIREDSLPGSHYYCLTDAGHQSLEALKNDLGPQIREEIDDYLQKNRLQFRNTVSRRADYYRTTEGDIAVRMQVIEHNAPLIDLTVTVPGETQAKEFCKRWKEKSSEIYSYIYKELSE